MGEGEEPVLDLWMPGRGVGACGGTLVVDSAGRQRGARSVDQP